MRAVPPKISPAWDQRRHRRAALAAREAALAEAVDPLGETGAFGTPVWAYPAVGVALFGAMVLSGAALIGIAIYLSA